jgi:hypothetical protein
MTSLGIRGMAVIFVLCHIAIMLWLGYTSLLLFKVDLASSYSFFAVYFFKC